MGVGKKNGFFMGDIGREKSGVHRREEGGGDGGGKGG